ncbi:MAG TPA: hypothetical protein VM425_06690 [Myxococcota bacterium]|nr:hypothetical protein [Myxococcota bacterium]
MKRITFFAMLCVFLSLAGCGSKEDPGVDAGPDGGFDGGGDQQPTAVSVIGRVVDSRDTPVPNATVIIYSDPVQAATDPDGRFEAEILTGRHSLTILKHDRVLLQMDFIAEGEGPVDLGTLHPDGDYVYNPLYLRGYNYLGADFLAWQHWCSLLVEDSSGRQVAGFAPGQFELTEELVRREDDATLVELPVDIVAQDADDDPETGFWESTTGGEPIDIVFLTDYTGSMGDYVAAIRDQVTTFVDRLLENHVDFRLGAVSFTSSFNFNRTRFMYGPLEADRFLDDMAGVIRNTGGIACATDAYEAIMFTPWLGWRPEARKVAVLVTDIVPQTVYGTFWYHAGNTCATLSSAKEFLEKHEIELVYSQNPECGDPGYDCEAVADRACDENSGLPALEQAGLAVGIGWPFQEEELFNLLFPPPGPEPPSRSRYLLAWTSGLDWWDPVGNLHLTADQYLVRMTLRASKPGSPGETLQTTWELPLERDPVDFVIHISDEEGNPLDDTSTALRYFRDGRPTRNAKWQLSPTDGVLDVLNLYPGRYDILTTDTGESPVQDFSLSLVDRRVVEVPEEGLTLELRPRPPDADAFLSLARGLIRDFDDWRISGDPFGSFAQDAELWLQDLEQGGLTWPEMVALKRFTVTLSAYANLNEYAQLETERAVEDFQYIVQDFRAVLDGIDNLKKSTEMSWGKTITSTALRIIYAVITQGRFTALEAQLQVGLKMLIDYASGYVVDEIRGVILAQFPRNDMFEMLEILFEECLVHNFGEGGGDPDWDRVMQAAMHMGIGTALDEVRRFAADGFVEAAFGSFDLDDPLEQEIKRLIQEVLRALTTIALDEGDGMQILGDAVEKFASGLGTYLQESGREKLLDLVDDVFDRSLDAMRRTGVPAVVRDFLMGFAKDLLHEAVPHMEESFGSQLVNFKIDTDRVVQVLIKHGLYNVVLRWYYAERAARSLGHILQNARSYSPEGEDADDWVSSMSSDFWDLRVRMSYLQTSAINALTIQQHIGNWAEGLEFLQKVLEVISGPLDFIAAIYPPLDDAAEAVHKFIIVLNGAEIITLAVQFGLKINELNELGKQSSDMYQMLLPD